jgi:gas vesicle protein
MTQQQPGTATASGGSDTGSGSSASDKASQVAQTAKESGTQVAQTAKESGTQVAQTAKESGTQVAQTAVEQAKSVASEAQRQTRNLVGEAQGQVREQARTQQQRARDGLRSLGDELRSMASNSDQSGPATDLAHQAADRAHAVADWLEQREPGDLLDEVRQFARRRPGAFLLGALVAGVAAGRMTRGIVAARSDQTDTSQGPGQVSQPDWSHYTEVTPVGEGLATAAVPVGSEFSSPYEEAMAPPVTPTAYVTDASPASGAPMYGAPTAGSGYNPQERP